MQEPTAYHGEPQTDATAYARHARTSPSSSRMLANYLAGIERLLDHQRSDAALRDAFDLPHIAVALADPQLHSSGERVKAWCDQWLRPFEAERDSHGSDQVPVHRILTEWIERQELSSSETAPTRALRRLRLSRLTRTALGGIGADLPTPADPQEAGVVETCSILIEAARRWYAHNACHDATVQTNLARLAVLR